MPYLTEELFQRLPHDPKRTTESICIAPFPLSLISFEFEDVESKMKLMLSSIKAFRSQMQALNIPTQARPEIAIRCKTQENVQVIKSEVSVIQSMLKSS